MGDRIFGPTHFSAGSGGYATHAFVPERGASMAPANLSNEQAAGFYIGFRTAYTALVTRTKIEAGETVLVLGGSGSSGAMAISLAKALGARVLAVASSEAGRAFCTRLGADAVIDREAGAIRAEVTAFTDGAGCDVVFDPVGGEIADAAMDVVARYGRFATIGFASGSWANPNPIDMVVGNFSVVGVLAAGFTADEDANDNAELCRMAGDDEIATPIGHIAELDEVPALIASLASGAPPGKLIVRT
jgi:NADPH2:quinone reductase